MSGHGHQEQLGRYLVTLNATPTQVKFHYIHAVLDECDGCVSEAARRMGIHRRTLQRMMMKAEPRGKAE